MNLLFGLGSIGIDGGEQAIAWQAHIGGFLAGLIGFRGVRSGQAGAVRRYRRTGPEGDNSLIVYGRGNLCVALALWPSRFRPKFSFNGASGDVMRSCGAQKGDERLA